jgi:hypothetical protein
MNLVKKCLNCTGATLLFILFPMILSVSGVMVGCYFDNNLLGAFLSLAGLCIGLGVGLPTGMALLDKVIFVNQQEKEDV